MYLFIFESIGTSELLLIGIIALIFLGPRRMPEIARKIGKIMAEFRTTTQEFRSTWEREVNFEEEAKAFDVDILEDEHDKESERSLNNDDQMENLINAPVIREIDRESFETAAEGTSDTNQSTQDEKVVEEIDVLSDKRTWL